MSLTNLAQTDYISWEDSRVVTLGPSCVANEVSYYEILHCPVLLSALYKACSQIELVVEICGIWN